MKKIIDQLTKLDEQAKAYADANPTHGSAQALRGRIRAALELAESPAMAGVKEPKTEAEKAEAKKAAEPAK